MTANRSAPRRAAASRALVDLTLDSDSDSDIHVKRKMDTTTNKRKRIPTPDTADTPLDSAEASSEEEEPQLGEEEFEIDYIVDSRLRTYKGKAVLEYFIHWKRYGKKDRSWTLADQLDDDDPPVIEFYKKNPRKPRRNQPTVLDLLRRQATSTPAKPSKSAKSTPNGKSTPAQPTPAKSTPVKSTPAKPTPAKSTPAKPTPTQSDSKPKSRAAPKERSASSDKENRPIATNSKVKDVQKKKKVVVESDDDDFVDSGEDDDASFKSDSEEEDAEESDEFEEEEAPKPVAKAAKKTNGGWGNRIKGKKKAAVNLGKFKTGVLPLEIKGDLKSLLKNTPGELPPINDINMMFDHLVSRLPAAANIAKRLNGRKLRVATMCSGTESPLLALNMIAQSIESQHGVTLAFEHVFSCEIEPFKQAYIERNFAPPLLFRDVTELGHSKAHTAYGAQVPVPGNVDILIAGTSCVDYSGLNNEKQDIDANGESGRTFRGMLQWVNKHRPPIVILENVCSAPWDKVVEYFEEVGYDANFSRLDTKEFYIPHTRTRVYLMATPVESRQHLPEKWVEVVKDLRRPWSSPFEAFLLPTDDVNIHRARLDLAAAKFYRDGTQRKPTDWGRCESRHARAREEEYLGVLRPLTSWQEAGVCKGLDWTWNDWLVSQTERVLDLLEISTLRMALDGIDAGYKACIWNVSQNVDRQTGSSRTALAPCLTPNMIPWVTNRGGPVTGREALALQGIPVRELLLTSENEDQLADLAGNAMTSTVVGASILAALHVSIDALAEGDDAMVDAEAERQTEIAAAKTAAARIVGEDLLEPHFLDLAKIDSADLADILEVAENSSRHCVCEGQSGTAQSPIQKCTKCGYRSCLSCGGRPVHVYEPCDNTRVEPAEFEKHFKELLPMRVKIAGISSATLDTIRETAKHTGKGVVSDKDWGLWSKAVLNGIKGAEFRFRYMKRQNIWTAVYEAPSATLELCLRRPAPEWHVTIKLPASEPVASRLRELLLHPVARLRLDLNGHDMLCGKWELCIPSKQSFKVKVKGAGDKVPTWQASLGLTKLSESMRYSAIAINVPPEAERALDMEISGTYDLLAQCGQAQSSLHARNDREENEKRKTKLTPIYFFLDPTRCGPASEDRYVFSTSNERLDYNTERPIIASFSNKWRESARDEEENVDLEVCGGWVVAEKARMTAVGGVDIAVDDNKAACDEALYAIPPSAETVSSSTSNCDHSAAILSIKVPLDASHSEDMWPRDKWGEIDLLHQGNATFANLAWITERLPLLDGYESWNPLQEVDASGEACDRCAPLPPKIHWIRQLGKLNKNGNKTKSVVIAFEDRQEAARYEHALKHRPTPFNVQLQLEGTTGKVRIGLNVMSLAHRALSRLPRNNAKGSVRLSWRLTPGQVADVPEPPRVFVMPSNKRDPQHTQPKAFKLPLRKEQLRSVWWMLQQERAEGKTHTFVEEEVSEALLPALGWRAEGKAERPVMVRGGVIADQVGYGKTIISLALIAETKGEAAPEPAPSDLIDLKATLIVVPGHLSKQWPSEITRFTGKLLNLILLQSPKDLSNYSIAELKKADVIVMASEIFENDAYWQRFEYLSAQPDDWFNDKQGGRFFAERLDTAMATLRTATEELKRNGTAASEFQKQQHQAAREEIKMKKKELNQANFGKRLKGSAYRDKYSEQPAKKKAKTNGGSKWEVGDDEEEEEEYEDDKSIPAPTFQKASGTQAFTSSTVQGNHKLLSFPLMHMFRFRRVIADEFTYLEKRALAALLRLSSCYKWVLSGTPPVNDFRAIRSIADFMGLHLGVEDDAEGNAQTQKARAKEQTAAEKFHAFREVHSAAWHRHRDDLAQEFLNVFVRQNVAEIEDIPTIEHIHKFKLPASEGAVYLELEHHLQALEMQARKETKFKNVSQGDRTLRLEEALSDSRTAEEALLKRCCHFTLDLTDKKRDVKSATEACRHIATTRRSQLEGCEEDLRKSINIGIALNGIIRKKGGYARGEAHPFRDWVEFAADSNKHFGDAEAAKHLVKVMAKCNIHGTTIPDAPVDGKAPKTESNNVEDIKWQLREHTHLLRRLSKELVARVRSLRFFEVIRKLQLNGDEAHMVLNGSECDHSPEKESRLKKESGTKKESGFEMAVLSCCGHVACLKCIEKAAGEQRCVVKDGGCHAAVRQTNIVKVSTLGIEGELTSGRYGAKLHRLVDLINRIPSNERVLVFLQWEDLMGKLGDALKDGGIQHATLAGSVKQRANTLERFQSTGRDSARVLLLKINDASAAGSNLTTANHAIFVGPLFTPSLLNYQAVETQAIGRVRRFGQQRHVHVHRLLAEATIDETIYHDRTKELQAKTDYVEYPKEEYDPRRRKRAPSEPIEVEELL